MMNTPLLHLQSLHPTADLQPVRLRQGLGSQIAGLASGITGLLGLTDASVTTASFRLSICPVGQRRGAPTPAQK